LVLGDMISFDTITIPSNCFHMGDQLLHVPEFEITSAFITLKEWNSFLNLPRVDRDLYFRGKSVGNHDLPVLLNTTTEVDEAVNRINLVDSSWALPNEAQLKSSHLQGLSIKQDQIYYQLTGDLHMSSYEANQVRSEDGSIPSNPIVINGREWYRLIMTNLGGGPAYHSYKRRPVVEGTGWQAYGFRLVNNKPKEDPKLTCNYLGIPDHA